MVGGFERGVGKQQVSRQTNIRFYWILHPPGEGRPSRRLCLSSTYRHPHSGSWKNSKGTLLVTDEGGEHLSLTPTSPWSESAVPSGRPRTLCYPYCEDWLLPSAFGLHPSQLLCLWGLQPLCFQGTGTRTQNRTNLWCDVNTTETDAMINMSEERSAGFRNGRLEEDEHLFISIPITHDISVNISQNSLFWVWKNANNILNKLFMLTSFGGGNVPSHTVSIA